MATAQVRLTRSRDIHHDFMTTWNSILDVTNRQKKLLEYAIIFDDNSLSRYPGVPTINDLTKRTMATIAKMCNPPFAVDTLYSDNVNRHIYVPNDPGLHQSLIHHVILSYRKIPNPCKMFFF